MYVDVDFGVDPATVVLAEPADCTRFHVAVRGSGDAGTLDRALRAQSVGSVDGDGEAVIDVAAVRRLAAGSVGATWDDDLAAMLAYARSKGWLSEDGGALRAHVEWG
jgi:hypothetical protein